MDLENIMLSEISQTERQILDDLIYTWNLEIVKPTEEANNGGCQGSGKGEMGR